MVNFIQFTIIYPRCWIPVPGILWVMECPFKVLLLRSPEGFKSNKPGNAFYPDTWDLCVFLAFLTTFLFSVFLIQCCLSTKKKFGPQKIPKTPSQEVFGRLGLVLQDFSESVFWAGFFGSKYLLNRALGEVELWPTSPVNGRINK